MYKNTTSYGNAPATTSMDQTMKIWDSKTGANLHTPIGHKDSVNSIKYAFNGKTIATTAEDGTFKIWIIDPDSLIQSAIE